jgi:hypothetical protein
VSYHKDYISYYDAIKRVELLRMKNLCEPVKCSGCEKINETATKTIDILNESLAIRRKQSAMQLCVINLLEDELAKLETKYV